MHTVVTSQNAHCEIFSRREPTSSVPSEEISGNPTPSPMEVHELEEAAWEQLHTYNQLTQDLLSNVSHELRTPITTLRGYLSLLEQGDLGPLTAAQHDAVLTMQRSLERLHGLIGNMLDLADLSRRQLKLQSKPVRVTDVLSHALQRVGWAAKDRGVILKKQLNGPLGTVLGDRKKLVQVVSHLLENAIKFSSPGHQVTLSAYRREGEAFIEVSDVGIGMTSEQAARAFVPFVQGEGGLTRRYGGLGLGLTLVDHLVSMHSGALALHSEPGKGTRVLLSLPLMEQSPGAKAA